MWPTTTSTHLMWPSLSKRLDTPGLMCIPSDDARMYVSLRISVRMIECTDRSEYSVSKRLHRAFDDFTTAAIRRGLYSRSSSGGELSSARTTRGLSVRDLFAPGLLRCALFVRARSDVVQLRYLGSSDIPHVAT